MTDIIFPDFTARNRKKPLYTKYSAEEMAPGIPTVDPAMIVVNSLDDLTMEIWAQLHSTEPDKAS